MDNNLLSHIVVTDEKTATKYVNVGWRIAQIRKVLLRGINKETTEYELIWEKSEPPKKP